MTKKRINNVILFNFSNFKNEKSKAGEICTKLLGYKRKGNVVGIYSKKLDIDDLRRQVNDFFKDINGNRCFAQDDNPFLLVPQTLMKDTFSGQTMFMSEFLYTAPEPEKFKQKNFTKKNVAVLLGIEESKITIGKKKDILPAPAAAEGEEEPSATTATAPAPASAETETPAPEAASAETEPSSPTQPRRLPAREPPSISQPQPQQDNYITIEGIEINKSHCRGILPIYVDEKKDYIDIVVNKDPMRGKGKISEWKSMNDAELIGYSKFDGKHHYRVRKIKRVPELIQIICNKYNNSRKGGRRTKKRTRGTRGTRGRRGTRRGRGTRG